MYGIECGCTPHDENPSVLELLEMRVNIRECADTEAIPNQIHKMLTHFVFAPESVGLDSNGSTVISDANDQTSTASVEESGDRF